MKALRYNPQAPGYFEEPLTEAYYMLRDYEKVIEIYRRWQNLPIHMHTHLAACYVQLGRMNEAEAAARALLAHAEAEELPATWLGVMARVDDAAALAPLADRIIACCDATRGKVVTARWPDPAHRGKNLGFPTME